MENCKCAAFIDPGHGLRVSHSAICPQVLQLAIHDGKTAAEWKAIAKELAGALRLFTSGHPESGEHRAQCMPCEALVHAGEVGI